MNPPGQASAQHHSAPAALDTTTAIKRPYDVLGYKLLLDWRPVFKTKATVFNGVSEITVSLSTDTITEIALDDIDLKVDSISINGLQYPPPGQNIGDSILRIPLPKDLRHKGATVLLRIAYTHTNPETPVGVLAGFLFYPKGTFGGLRYRYDTAGFYRVDSEFVQEDLAYTMSESQDARRWMPCNDEPYDKANSEISIIVPSTYSAQSNGTLQSVDTNADGSLTFHWKSDRPVSTYLMCASASKWTEWRDYYHRVSKPADSVPLLFFAWPQDYDGTGGTPYNGRNAYRNTAKMLEADSRAFGEYPFKQYGQINVQPFYWGGMEHQTMTANSRSVMDSSYPDESTIAHELFHQWFGDKTTCETWADIWLNEGFATFGQMFWEESAHGPDAYNSIMRNFASGYLNSNLAFINAPIYNPPVYQDQWATNYVANTYYKAGCVLHMLRRVLADDTLFYNTLRDYSAAYAYTTANTFQFRNFIQDRDGSRSPIDLFEFINQWILGPGFPNYAIAWSQDSLNMLTVRVHQSQTKTDHFTMPLHFKAVSAHDTTGFSFINNSKTQYFTIQLDHPFDTLVFDTNAVPISKFTVRRFQNLSVGTGQSAVEMLHVNVSDGAVKLSFAPVVSEGANVRVIDVLGRTVLERGVLQGAMAIAIPERSLASGDYFAMLMDGARHATIRFQITK
jgi:aminopeptidase N